VKVGLLHRFIVGMFASMTNSYDCRTYLPFESKVVTLPVSVTNSHAAGNLIAASGISIDLLVVGQATIDTNYRSGPLRP
jgi:hypothetical protein